MASPPFPFNDLNNDEFLQVFTNVVNIPVHSLSSLDKMEFENFSQEHDRQPNDQDPDNFLQNNLGMLTPNCTYVFPGQPFANAIRCDENIFSVINHNIHSIPEHFDEFVDQCLALNNTEIDIIGFTETKLTDDIQQLYNLPNYHTYFNNHSRNSGGVALFIHIRFSSQQRSDLSFQEDFLECVFADIKTSSGSILIGELYHRPKSNVNLFIEKIQYTGWLKSN